MTRKELSQIYYINKEIEMWERELENVTSLQSPKLDGLPRGSETGDSTASKALQAAQISEIISGLLAKLQMKRKEIYDYIATVDDSLMRQIIMYRCISLCTWEEVAIYVGGGNSADSVRKLFVRFVR
jgi:hypothetical protein